MDDSSDPREISRDAGLDAYGAITDEEVHSDLDAPEDPSLTEEERRILRKAREIQNKFKKGKIEKTSIPQRLVVDEQKSAISSKASQSTSYFLNALEKTREQQTQEKSQRQELMNKRVYTFNDNMDVIVEDCDELEEISGQPIMKRYIKHEQLLEFFKDIKVLRIGKAMAKITPPNFEEPKYPNWCCVGIISSKSSPRATSNNNGRFIKLSITDFKFVIDIHIFGTGVEKYNKLRVGDIIAVLNPGIFVKRTETTEVFSFSIKHGYNCILEIGKSKNFGACQALKRDGNICGSFINKATSDCCDFHKDLRLRKTAASRMELQQSYRMNAHVKNGVKQSMFLGKPDGKARLLIADDHTAPKTDKFSRARTYFSNDETHRAFFHGKKIMNEMFANTDAVKNSNKLKKDREQRIKEMNLQQKLSNTFKEGRNLSKISGLSVNLDLKGKKDLLSAAFNKETLLSLGFDPTSKSSERGVLSSLNENENDVQRKVLNELRDITKAKKIELGASKEESMKRKKQRNEADNMIKRLKTRTVEPYLPPVVKPRGPGKNDLVLSDSSDEDLEIEDKSFSAFKNASK